MVERVVSSPKIQRGSIVGSDQLSSRQPDDATVLCITALQLVTHLLRCH